MTASNIKSGVLRSRSLQFTILHHYHRSGSSVNREPPRSTEPFSATLMPTSGHFCNVPSRETVVIIKMPAKSCFFYKLLTIQTKTDYLSPNQGTKKIIFTACHSGKLKLQPVAKVLETLYRILAYMACP